MKAGSHFALPVRYLGFFILLSLLLRGITLFVPVVDHDESTYIVIADAMLRGQVYLRDVIDTKPIGIFLLFAAFLKVFGKSILTIRLVTMVWIALTAWLISLVHHALIKPVEHSSRPYGPLASGIIYIVMTSVFVNYGLSPNTEHFFALFSILALYLLVSHEGILWALLAGFLLGAGFMIKYVVAADALAIGLFFVWRAVAAKKKWTWWMVRGALMITGFLIPLSITWMYYRNLGMEETFRFFTFELSGRYFVETPWTTKLSFTLDFIGRYIPVVFWFIYCTRNTKETGSSLPMISWTWAILALFIILLPGRPYYHYFIQLMIPMSILAGSFFDTKRELPLWLSWMKQPGIGMTLVLIAFFASLYVQKIKVLDKRNYVRETSEWLQQRIQPGDIIYTANYHQVLYFLTGSICPTPYVHPSLLWDEQKNDALKIDVHKEWNSILGQRPKYILLRVNQSALVIEFMERISSQYHQATAFGKELVILERTIN